MSNTPIPPALARNDDAPAYWFLDILWIVLASDAQTAGRFTIMEQLMPQGAGPGLHVHPQHDEWFYVMEGALDMQVGETRAHATAGQSVFIPRGTAHAFQVASPTCRVLNGFTPAAMDAIIRKVARVAERRELPPPGLDRDPASLKAFADNEVGHPVPRTGSPGTAGSA